MVQSLRVVVMMEGHPLERELVEQLARTHHVAVVTYRPVPLTDWSVAPGRVEVSAHPLDLHEIEMACAGADVLLWAPTPYAGKVTQADPSTLLSAMVDTVSRALEQTRVSRVVCTAQLAAALDGRAELEVSSVEAPAALKSWTTALDDVWSMAQPETMRGAEADTFNGAASASAEDEVVSVQHFAAQSRASAREVAHRYFEALAASLPGVRIRGPNPYVSICLFGVPLLVLREDKNRVSDAVYTLCVEAGALARKPGVGRFEFRCHGDAVWVMLFKFQPRLPWWLYRLTQAPMHLRSVTRFAKTKVASARV
jgi:hypothetical protein